MSLPISETALVSACLEILALKGCFAWRQNQGAMAAEYKGKTRFIRFAGAKGISDIIGVLPDGRFLSVECKVGRNKATDWQADFQDCVRRLGGVAFLIYSSDQLLRELKAIGV